MSTAGDLRAAVGFLTPLPGGSWPPSGSAMAWFPTVGAGMGWALGNFWALAARRLPGLPAAVLTVAADCALTGGLHLDGLADTADGLLAHTPSRARLDIMAEPQVGAFAATAISLALLARAAALSTLSPSPALLAALYCSSRTAMVVASRALPYARGEGLVTAFLPGRARPGGALAGDPAVAAGLAGALAAVLLARRTAGRRGAGAVLVGWAGAAGVLELARRRLSGFTGDVLGAAGVVCETLGLLAAAAAAARPPAGSRRGQARRATR